MSDIALTVLFDARCPLCRMFSDWLARQPLLVPLRLVACGSPEARRLFPDLDHERTLEEITVVADDGRAWTRDAAWVMALWATRTHRPWAERLATPAGLPFARAAAQTAAGLRQAIARRNEDGSMDDCVDSCRPLAQG